MGKKWRDAAEVERGCSDREDSAESRRRSRSASRGRFAESWKRLSSKQGSTKRSGLPSQQTPVSGREWPGEPADRRPLPLGAPSPVHGAELACTGAARGNLWSRSVESAGGRRRGEQERLPSPHPGERLWMASLEKRVGEARGSRSQSRGV